MNLRFLRPLYDTPGPWASVYLDDSRDDESGREQVALRWRALQESLRRQGAQEPTVHAVEEAVAAAAPPPGRH
ncbi:MAG: peptide chain release factor 1, partial [Hamadaea sp.]|nr:peptide chain release factor 1 [Hamadaea sp.]